MGILKTICEEHALDPEKSKKYLGLALKKGIETEHFKMAKESGKGSMCYKLNMEKKSDKGEKKSESVKGDKKSESGDRNPSKDPTSKKTAAPKKTATERGLTPPKSQQGKKTKDKKSESKKVEKVKEDKKQSKDTVSRKRVDKQPTGTPVKKTGKKAKI